MSLDVYLTIPGDGAYLYHQRRDGKIFVREDGRTVEITREEWDRRYPDREPFMCVAEDPTQVFDVNITHNLRLMANAVGLYEPLWRPEEIGVTKASQLVPLLTEGLALLLADPEKYRALNPENGWGTYESLVEFVRSYLDACQHWPMAEVSVSR